MANRLKAAILIVSETATQDPNTDRCIPLLEDAFEQSQQWEVLYTKFVRDDVLEIQRSVMEWTDTIDPVNLVVTSGGTGFAAKDHTPEVHSNSLLCVSLSLFVNSSYEGSEPTDTQTCVGSDVSKSTSHLNYCII